MNTALETMEVVKRHDPLNLKRLTEFVRLEVDTGYEFRPVVVLKHDLLTYLQASYFPRAKSWEREVGRTFPISFDRLVRLSDVELEAEARGNFTRVKISAVDDRLVHGVGFAKRSFDQPRLERGVALALDRAIDDLIVSMARYELLRFDERQNGTGE